MLVFILSNNTMDRSLSLADLTASKPSSSIGHKLNSSVNVYGLILQYSLSSNNSVEKGKVGLFCVVGYDFANISIYFLGVSLYITYEI
jgi:hypothetical protein